LSRVVQTKQHCCFGHAGDWVG